MGADMLVACFSELIDENIDFKAGHAYIDKEDWVGRLGKDIVDEGFVSNLHGQLKNIEDACMGKRRDCTYLEFAPYRIYLTGGESWGDSPTSLFNDINDLEELGVLDACGFNQVIDYQRILKKILKQKKVLPGLLGLDDDLDEMISDKLKGRK